MNLDEKSDRRVLPIWNKSVEATNLPELLSIKKPPKANARQLTTAYLISELGDSDNLGVAIELFNTALIEGNKEGVELAARTLETQETLPFEVSRLLGKWRGKAIEQDLSENPIRVIKNKLKNTPKNPLLWFDLARLHTIAGRPDQATRAILTGLQLAKNHRWATRVAARYFVHIGEIDRAHRIVLNNPMASSDPWLAATELSVAQIAKVNPRLWSAAKKLIEKNFIPLHTAELTSSIATFELKAGAAKKAKSLFLRSLYDPNKSTLAQAKWAERNSSFKLIGKEINQRKDAYEAQFWTEYRKMNMQRALSYSCRWLDEEPYSSKAAICVTATAAVLDDYKTIELASKHGCRANPDDLTLRLNQIYVKLALLNTADAPTIEEQRKIEEELRSLTTKDDSISAHAEANLGLLFYRTGNLELGKEHYKKAEDKFSKNGHAAPAFMALLNHAREAIIAQAPICLLLLKRIQEMLGRSGPHITPGAQYYALKLSRLSKSPDNWLKALTQNVDDVHLDENEEPPLTLAPLRFDFDTSRPTIWLPPGFNPNKS